jgi:copper ion binding protein
MANKIIILNVDGMTCSHCEKRVTNTVAELPGVANVTVSLADKTVTVDYDPQRVDLRAMKEAIEDQGYAVG